MTNRKTVLALFLITLLSVSAFAQNASDFKTDGKGTITGYEGWDKVITIPAQIDGVPITVIGSGAFKNMGLTDITLPESIKTIEVEAFSSNKLTTLTLPAGVAINKLAFSKNSNLKNLVLGANIVFYPSTFGIPVYFEYMSNSRKAGTFVITETYTEKTERDYKFVQTKYGSVITRYTGNEISQLDIPAQLGGVAVKGIGGYSIRGEWFGAFQNKRISRMRLPESIVFIADSYPSKEVHLDK